MVLHINAYLHDSALDAGGRRCLVQEQCGPLDGRAAQRVAHAIIQYGGWNPDYTNGDQWGNAGIVHNLGHNMPVVNDEYGYIGQIYPKPRVRVNMISPGGILRDQPEPFVRRYAERTPLGRMAAEDDLLGAVAYLASDLSAYVTGHNLVVDGGWTIW